MPEADMNRTDGMHNHERDIATITAWIPPLNDDLFARELDYQAGMSIAERLLRQGLLSEGDHRRTKALLLANYRPPIGTLLAEVG